MPFSDLSVERGLSKINQAEGSLPQITAFARPHRVRPLRMRGGRACQGSPRYPPILASLCPLPCTRPRLSRRPKASSPRSAPPHRPPSRRSPLTFRSANSVPLPAASAALPHAHTLCRVGGAARNKGFSAFSRRGLPSRSLVVDFVSPEGWALTRDALGISAAQHPRFHSRLSTSRESQR